MFTIKTNIKHSNIHGLGVFAEEKLKKGDIIWKFQPGFDQVISSDAYNQLPPIAKNCIDHFGYYNKEEGGYILCGDDARFTNHSNTPNMELFDEISSVATKDINIGDEITENYYIFDEFAHKKLTGFTIGDWVLILKPGLEIAGSKPILVGDVKQIESFIRKSEFFENITFTDGTYGASHCIYSTGYFRHATELEVKNLKKN